MRPERKVRNAMPFWQNHSLFQHFRHSAALYLVHHDNLPDHHAHRVRWRIFQKISGCVITPRRIHATLGPLSRGSLCKDKIRNHVLEGKWKTRVLLRRLSQFFSLRQQDAWFFTEPLRQDFWYSAYISSALTIRPFQIRLCAHRPRGLCVHHAVGDHRALLRHHLPSQEARPQALAHILLRIRSCTLQPAEVLRIKVCARWKIFGIELSMENLRVSFDFLV